MGKIRSTFVYLWKHIFEKPTAPVTAHDFIVHSVWLLRIFSFLFGIYQIFWGETLIGFAIIISVMFILTPSLLTNSLIKNIPVEMEFFLFLVVLVQFVIGEANNFYINVPYYDKFVHLFLPFLLGFMGFVIAYTLYFSGKLKVSIPAMIFLVTIITLGIGAFWEIIEYANDTIILKIFPDWHRFQGTTMENALTDTMHDLIADLVGGLVGAVVALRYILQSKYDKRLKEIFREIIRELYTKSTKHIRRRQRS